MTRSYMFNDRNTSSQRRKREDQQVELRRQRTEELLNKKRVSSQNNELTASFDASKAKLYSSELEEIYQGAFDCRSCLSIESNPPIQPIIDSGIVPRFVELLDINFYQNYNKSSIINKIRIEAAWVITNIVL